MRECFYFYDAHGTRCTVAPDCVSQHSDGRFYDHSGHPCFVQPYGIVEGTAHGDLIDAAHAGDPEGDRIDHNDAVLGGKGSNDDIIYGYGGNDTTLAGLGNDTAYGGDGKDVLYGGSGNDSLMGDAGADRLNGGAGAGADTLHGGAGGCDHDTLDLTGAGPLRVTYDPHNPENGAVEFFDATDHHVTGCLTFKNMENVIPCFTPGTLIATPRGEVPVEALKPGDRIITRDNGIQEIRWIGRKDLSWSALSANPHLKPVLIRAGCLGGGLPEADMLVSPNHRMLVANDRTQLYFDEHEVLVAAKHLVSAPGVRIVDVASVTYLHFMCDRHEVVLSNGAWTETFQPGDYTLKGIGNAQRAEIFELFPELKTDEGLDGYAAARRTLKRHEAILVAR